MIRAMWLGLLLSLAACSTQAPNVITLTPKGRNVIEINNSSFHDSVSIEGGKALYNGDLLECVVTMRCHEDENVDFEYYWEFYDADGFIMDDTTALWSPVTIPAGVAKQYNTRAPKAGAVRAKFMARQPLGH